MTAPPGGWAPSARARSASTTTGAPEISLGAAPPGGWAPSVRDRPSIATQIGGLSVTTGNAPPLLAPGTIPPLAQAAETAVVKPPPPLTTGEQAAAAGQFLADAAKTSLTAIGRGLVAAAGNILGATDTPGPSVSDEEAERLRAGGYKGVLSTPKERAEAREGWAMWASLAAGGKVLGALRSVPVPTPVKVVASNVAGTGAYSALRERVPGESLVQAILTDQLITGGLLLGGSIVHAATRPTRFTPDLLPHGIGSVRPPIGSLTDDPKIIGAAIAEDIIERGRVLSTEGMEAVLPEVALPDGVIQARTPNNIGPLRRQLGRPGAFGEIGGITGDAAARITRNAVERSDVADALTSEFRAAVATARTEAMSARPRNVPKAAWESQLAELMDTVFLPEGLPEATPPGLRRPFERMRNIYMSSREALRVRTGKEPDWGIDAYLPHVFEGNYLVQDASGATLAVVTSDQVQTTAASLMAEDASRQLRVVPQYLSMPNANELFGLGLSPRKFYGMASAIADALTLEPAQVAELLQTQGVAQPAAKRKFFRHMMERKANLPGFRTDVFDVSDMFAVGFARKMAYHDFEEKALAVISKMEQVPGTEPTAAALRTYVDEVLGRPTQMQQSFTRAAQWLAEREPAQAATSLPGVTTERLAHNLDLNTWINRVNKFELFNKLGYNFGSVFAQLTAIPINVYPVLGEVQTLRAMRTLFDAQRGKQWKEIEGLLRGLGLDVAVPLSAAETAFAPARELAPWHYLFAFNKGDRVPRAVAGIGMYDKLIREGIAPDIAIQRAKDFVRQTNFTYRPADTPEILRGPLGRGLGQFKSFLLKEMKLLYDYHQNPKTAARLYAGVMAVGGVSAVLALPHTQLLDWASGQLTGEKLSERAKANLPTGVAFGLPGLAGVDISPLVSLYLPSELGQFFGPGPSDALAILGTLAQEDKATLELIRAKGGILNDDDKAVIVKRLVPRFITKAMEGFNVAESGQVRDQGGNLLFRPDDPEKEGVVTALGFKSVERSRAEAESRAANRQVKQFEKARGHYADQIVRALEENDMARVSELFRLASERGYYVTADMIRERFRSLGRDRYERIFRSAPRPIRALMTPPGVTLTPEQ